MRGITVMVPCREHFRKNGCFTRLRRFKCTTAHIVEPMSSTPQPLSAKRGIHRSIALLGSEAPKGHADKTVETKDQHLVHAIVNQPRMSAALFGGRHPTPPLKARRVPNREKRRIFSRFERKKNFPPLFLRGGTCKRTRQILDYIIRNYMKG